MPCHALPKWITFYSLDRYCIFSFSTLLHKCRILQNIWQQYILNAVTEENAACMKVLLPLEDSQIHGYLLVILLVNIQFFSFLKPCFLYISMGLYFEDIWFCRDGDKCNCTLLLIYYSWQNGATYCTSELAILKNSEIHTWDRGYDDDGNQVGSTASLRFSLS